MECVIGLFRYLTSLQYCVLQKNENITGNLQLSSCDVTQIWPYYGTENSKPDNLLKHPLQGATLMAVL